jgi:hypothetical protein
MHKGRLKLGGVLMLCALIVGCGGGKEPGRHYGQGYSIKVPDTWQKSNVAPGANFARMNKEGTITVNIASQKISSEITLEKVVEVTQARSRAGGIAVVNSQEAMVGDTKGHVTVKNMKVMGRDFIIQEYHVVKDGTAHSVVFTIDRERGEAQRGEIDPIVESIRFK